MIETYLISRSVTNKIRVFHLYAEEIENELHPYIDKYIIHRESYQLHGKVTKQPDLVVDKGLAKRTLKEQFELRYNHLVKEKLDKGYRKIDCNPDELSLEEINNILGEVVTGQDGVCKPMLAKQADKVTNKKIFDKKWLASRKIDGLRALIYMGDDGELHTASRGAMNYDGAMVEILSNKKLIKCFKDHPGLIMDGECYHHGYTLQQLNSIARTQKVAKDLEVLQFFWYDIVDVNKSFKERLKYMMEIRDELQLQFQPNEEFDVDELRIQFVPHVEISGWDNILNLHNTYVSEGWEGLVIRDPNKVYRPNGRTNDMIKVKVYKDDTFKVIGYELGLRGTEDMVFVMEMEDGRTFKAKPFGDREQKEEYVNNFEELYKDHIGECKFFYYSDDGIPLQPAFKAFRDDTANS